MGEAPQPLTDHKMRDEVGNHRRDMYPAVGTSLDAFRDHFFSRVRSGRGLHRKAADPYGAGHDRLRARHGVQEVVRKRNHREAVRQQGRRVAATRESAGDFACGVAGLHDVADSTT